MSDKWMTIDSAPKDGTTVDLWTNDSERVCDAYWLTDTTPPGWYAPYMDYLDTGPVECDTTKATHWMPLPPAPKDASHD